MSPRVSIPSVRPGLPDSAIGALSSICSSRMSSCPAGGSMLLGSLAPGVQIPGAAKIIGVIGRVIGAVDGHNAVIKTPTSCKKSKIKSNLNK